ncbi:hypothetical protein PHPALM_30888 [Phytophthora palmivora]|uniref:Uncharacterized protein n=1 Tax=Phytophthora palmivora TaxID=4796 RepID=A0A2P4X3Z5_9STRA|nr:hypothetical protein PHPALM_30888 [Phytophthora palmivora]
MESAKYNHSQQVLDVLTAYLILHYLLITNLQADGQAVWRLGSFSDKAPGMVFAPCGLSSNDPETSLEQVTTSITGQSNQSKIIHHQHRVIDQLMEHMKRQDERMDNL